ncbi:YchJ family protein [Gallaecimonas pentaromativorans]|uniref:YchJ family protein n=1 Tax=Gallaecimonas pentaromativorans TaxID=584787 RepID=UPI00067E966A|nr:YchJ family protein [Gallaecimonas pentaromativorans]MED5525772.1 YchJ family protein [Pseudomonadota bacterium]
MPADCPCGSGRQYPECCGPLHQGATAVTAEALMRARYCAHVVNAPQFILDSWHPDSRPTLADIAPFIALPWHDLQILGHLPGEQESFVTFLARYQQDEGLAFHLEKSRFLKIDGNWLFHSGTYPEPERNAPCPCGSGRKYKTCCRR